MSDLYRRLLEAHGRRGETIPVRPTGAPAPLSLPQEHMWMVGQFRRRTTRTNPLRRLRILGRLDATALHDAFRDLQARHETLRTRLPMVDGHPVQVVSDAVDIELLFEDLTHLSGPDQQARLSTFPRVVRGVLDVENGPLWGVLLARLGDEEHQLFIVLHETISDGASFNTLYRELAAFYSARTTGSDPDLAPLTIQYADYATWQRKNSENEDFTRHVDYWRNHLQGAKPVRLPTRRPLATRTRTMTIREARVEPHVASAFRDLCATSDATLFMGVLAASLCVLARYTGERDISIGTPVVNRLQRQTRSLIGRFANGVLLRTDLSGHPSFAEVLNRARETALDAFAHQEVPLERIFDVLMPKTNAAATLFNVMLALHGETVPLQLGDCKSEEVVEYTGTARNDLLLAISPMSDGGLLVQMWFDPDHLDPEIGAQMANDVVRVVQDASGDSTSAVAILAAPAIASLKTAVPDLAGLQVESTDLVVLPSRLAELLHDGDWPAEAPRRVVCMGEGLTPALQARFFERLPTCPLFRVYSIEQLTNASSWHCLPEPNARTVPIGRMGGGGACYVLDDALCPVPPGATGELFIAVGGGTTTDMAVEPDPFREAGNSMVRTGARARLRIDGAVEWLGSIAVHSRHDELQIELTDVEAVIAQLPDVLQAVVAVRDGQLVGYVLARDGFDVKAARAHVASQLPGYMLPTAYVTLEAFPMHPWNEVDRDRLPAPVADAYKNEHHVEPRTEEELQLAAVWQKLLGIERISVRDDFFALGGHSLLAIRLLAEIERCLGVKLPLRELFDASTLEGLAAKVSQKQVSDGSVERPMLYASATRIARLPAALRGVFKLNKLMTSDRFARHVWSAWIDGPLDARALERAVGAMRERHPLLRTRFFEENGRSMLEVLEVTDVERFALLEQTDLSMLDNDARERADAEFHRTASFRPLDIGHGEVMTVALSRLSPTRHRLTVSLHNIASDAASLATYVKEMCELWRAFVEDPERDPVSILPPALLHYHHLADYLARVNESVAGRALRALWKARLDGIQPLELPTDFPRDQVDARREANAGVVAFRSASLIREIDNEVLSAIEQIAEDQRASVMSTLVAAMAGYLSQRTSQRDLAFITRLSYRYLPGLDHALGFLVNPILLRISTEGEPTFPRLVERTHTVVNNAFDNGECDLFDLAPSSVFRLCLVYTRTTPSDGAALPLPAGHVATRVGPSEGTAESQIGYDLVLWLSHRDDRVRLHLAYNLELFRDTTAAAFLEGYVKYVADACRHGA